jgi:hypothetical protein
MRTHEQINADYSTICLELGDIEAKASKLMARKQQLLQRIPMLDEEHSKTSQAMAAAKAAQEQDTGKTSDSAPLKAVE